MNFLALSPAIAGQLRRTRRRAWTLIVLLVLAQQFDDALGFHLFH